MKIVPKNWGDFQHYKDRAPTWIKLHRSLLDNFEYQCLPVASRALAPMLWLLASESESGEIDATPKKLAFRLRMTEREVTDALKPLIDNGFFDVEQDASSPLAEVERVASLEKRREEREKEERREEGSAPHGALPAITLPLVGGTEFSVSAAQVAEWTEAYPAVNVSQQLREMRAWCQANPSNRKTAKGINAFIVRWLAKEQDKGGRIPFKAESFAEQNARAARERVAAFAPGIATQPTNVLEVFDVPAIASH